ncbi:hypothetical protein C0992_009320 [Termitomyces sp. T32_za158]|nr:hypothetical protein C0992_009320 [Termitomyces sp. T32_za158]
MAAPNPLDNQSPSRSAQQSLDDNLTTIFRTATLQDLALLTQTPLQLTVHSYLDRRICTSLTTYGLSADCFLYLLGAADSVLSGSFVLSLLMLDRDINPTDLDIYVPNQYRALVIGYLQLHGYYINPDPIYHGYGANDTVNAIVRLH